MAVAAALRRRCRELWGRRQERRASLPIVDQLFLNPFEKWTRYGRVPWTFCVHVVLLALVTTQSLVLFSRDVQHVSRTARHFSHLFVGSSDGGAADELHSPQELRDAVNSAVYNHFLINNLSIVEYMLTDPERLDISVTWRDELQPLSATVDREAYMAAVHNSTSSDQGPVHEYLRKVLPCLYDTQELPLIALVSMTHSLSELPGRRHRALQQQQQQQQEKKCLYQWEVRTTFDGSEAGAFYGRVRASASDCRVQRWGWLRPMALVTLFLAALAAVLILRKFCRSMSIARRLLATPDARAKVSFWDLWVLFSPWWVLALFVNLVQFVASTVCLQDHPMVGHRFQSIGISCFFTWVNMIQYFESFPGFYMAFHTMSLGAGRVFRFLFSVGPLAAGFVFLGVCLFWQASGFESPGAAACLLFSLMNGDEVHETFEKLYGVAGFLGHVYLYCFLFIFIFVIMNVNITIISDAYECAKRHPQREGQRFLRHLAEEHYAGQRPARSQAHSPVGTPPRSPEMYPTLPPAAADAFGCFGQPRPQAVPPDGLLRLSSFREPAEQQAGIGSPSARGSPRHPERAASRKHAAVPNMNPRFWHSSSRIHEALLAAYPEQAVLAHQDSVRSLALPRAFTEDEAATAAAAAPPSLDLGPSAENMELVNVGNPWAEFDAALRDLQESVRRLRCCPRPDAVELGAALQGLASAADLVAARRTAAAS